MAWLHTWAGLVPGWVLFLVFLFGTTAFFQQEISGWMRPELRAGGVTAGALHKVGATLARKAPDAAFWSITLPSPRGGDAIRALWRLREDGSGESGEAVFDPATGEEQTLRDTRGGWFLYRFHFDLHYMPWWVARYIVCSAALAMLVAILSGIVTHKKLFADFFLLRFGKGQRSWLDAHNITGVLALPFHLMMTYTGLVALLFTLMPWAISANYGSEEAFYKAASSEAGTLEASGRSTPVAPLPLLIAQAETQWGMSPSSLVIFHPGDAAAVATFSPLRDGLGNNPPPLHLNAVTGAVQDGASSGSGAARATEGVMVQLHAGWFAGPVLRWLYFLSGIGGTVMVASGLVLWTVKRRAKQPDPARPHFGFRLVERLNIGVIAGTPAGIAVYFLANRLLPLGMANRADWEINSLFIAWGGLFVWTVARPAKRAWIEALSACAALYALVPVVNAFTTERGLVPSLIARDWIFAGFDLAMLTSAAALALAAWKVAAYKPKAAPRRKARELAEAVT
ncbi:PepSY domain-containing protein [Sandaracinobacter sp. RS1-74]|uniref:PepSY-associated TM helix domain-containing protein n=1 Tax=Sandaracinobacteroides sayramensis TaxID=2913411 RepID=UPI001EDA1B05|nr:PepSY-associated TM helix domain-containing protein [Sandaracinobacteroides sayramensis]MCG2841295.1 PepSY domain-containing protein [Sandaracinobacteroides sayramensis]